MAISPLLLGRFIIAERFDLILSAAVALMVAFAVRRSFGWSWAMLGVAVLVKLVPVLLAPLLFIWQRRTRPRGRCGVTSVWGSAWWLPVSFRS